MVKGRMWSYKDFKINEGLKPGSKHFQYFFTVSEKGKKKCNYCVWIDDKNLSRLNDSNEFEEIISLKRDEWTRWVQRKIDEQDFRNLVLKLEKTGQREIDLAEMEKKLEPE
jgi:chemotaxis regulatin CheY-phosphate phosphatase CheZ